MPSNIKNNSVKSLKFRCIYDEYYDFMLYRGECYGDTDLSDCLMAEIDAEDIETPSREYNDGQPTTKGGEVYSKVTWAGSICENTLLKDIGLTGTDNGFISYRKDQITNRTFLEMLTGTTYPIFDMDTRFFMTPISGNTGIYKYPIEINRDEKGKYFSMKGGFYQGFFKLFGFDYQTLPTHIENDWCMSFVLRKRSDYQVSMNTLNDLYPQNNGIFFYMGTRAENKFWEMYNEPQDKEEFLIPNAIDPEYFADDFMGDDGEYIDEGVWCDDYAEKDIDEKDITAKTSDDKDLDKKGYFEIETDNKFIFFNRTCTGFTVNDWDEDMSIILTGRTQGNSSENKFITYNRTCTGKTVNDEDSEDTEYVPYDIYKDIKNNAFALRIDEQGRIGYKFATIDCDDEAHHYGVKEEYSKEGIIPSNEWVTVSVRFTILNGNGEKCSKDIGQRKMKIYIYVNGYLIFVSKELPEFNFRELDDIYEKQEGVPYSLSLGGGTQGLLETIGFDYEKPSKYSLPIEKAFAGTFLGDIRSFKFFNCFKGIESVRN